MKAVILAGGLGTRLSEESGVRPKPLVEVGGKPILWHIMQIYAAHGIHDFVICCGYKGHMIREYILGYAHHASDMTVNLATGEIVYHRRKAEPWCVTLVETGENTMTGGRLLRARRYLDNSTFCLTYGDGVSNVDLRAAIDFHRREGVLATLTAVNPPGRFGAFTLPTDEKRVTHFREKARDGEAWVNGGFFVLEPQVLDYIDGDDTVWEHEPMVRLSEEGQLAAYRHDGFWQPMDTLRDRNLLEELWASGTAPWKVWT
jgi:glucose-1-phosphate cytidylyltransferase